LRELDQAAPRSPKATMTISRKRIAKFMLDRFERPEYIGMAPVISER
jgi:hypothetical protein